MNLTSWYVYVHYAHNIIYLSFFLEKIDLNFMIFTFNGIFDEKRKIVNSYIIVYIVFAYPLKFLSEYDTKCWIKYNRA